MGRLLTPILDMMRFRSGPQDLPTNAGITLFLAVLYIGGGFAAGSVLNEPDYAGRALLAIGMQFGIVIVLLRFKEFGARVQQTIGALSGTGFLFGMMSIYILGQIDVEEPQAGLALMYLLLFLWSLAVDGHIYRHALSSKMGTGVLVAVIIFTINFTLLRAVFGQ